MIGVRTCGHHAGQPACTPLIPTGCSFGESQILDFRLPVNPIDARLCPGRLEMFLTTRPDHETFAEGGAEIQWRGQEYEPDDAGGCRAVGPPLAGSAVVAGPCCETVLDFRYPHFQYVFRAAVRTDWR